MAAVLLASLAGILFGAFTVALRFGLRRYGDAEVGALASVVAAFGVGAIAALVPFEGPEQVADLWPYLVGGVLAPGVSQHLYVIAVRDIGSSRAGIVVGAAPLLSALVAIVFLDEPVRAAIVVGTLLIVVGGALLAGERDRPVDFKAIGALFALGCALFFGIRDNVVRWAQGEADVPPSLGVAIVLGAGGVAFGTYLALTRGRRVAVELRRALPPFAPAGLLFGLAYVCILEALSRGRVTVVAPLIATESLWAVLFALVLLRRSEMIGRRIVAAAALVVAGGVTIGIWF